MRDLKYETRYGAADDAELRELEAALGTALPAEYRRFLLEDGGGWAPRVKFFQARPGKPNAQIDPAEWQWLNEFLEWRREPRTAGSVWTERETYLHREPGDYGLSPDLLPIASATGGAYRVLLGIAGGARGRVFVCDTNTRPENPDPESVADVADSFDAWLESLKDASAVPEQYRDV